jgi:hypothetical protein
MDAYLQRAIMIMPTTYLRRSLHIDGCQSWQKNMGNMSKHDRWVHDIRERKKKCRGRGRGRERDDDDEKIRDIEKTTPVRVQQPSQTSTTWKPSQTSTTWKPSQTTQPLPPSQPSQTTQPLPPSQPSQPSTKWKPLLITSVALFAALMLRRRPSVC